MSFFDTLFGRDGLRCLFDVSSADPGKLLDYASWGQLMDLDLSTKASTLSTSVDSLTTASDPHGLLPSMGDVADRLTDLVGDWAHLDDFVSDVGAGFAKLLVPNWGGNRDAVRAGVVAVPDHRLAATGQIGLADRDDAINAARADALALQDLLDGDPSVDDVEAIIDRVRRGQYDPAYAVTLATVLGPDGLFSLVDTIEDAWDYEDADGTAVDAGWGLGQLAPLSTVLTTAADTQRDVPLHERIDESNATLPDSMRLDREWLDEFVEMGTSGDPADMFDVSLLASQATLPTYALLTLAEAANVSDLIRSNDGPAQRAGANGALVWGPSALTTEGNVLRGLGNNPDAAETWLTQIGGDEMTNAEALLRYEIDETSDASRADIEALGAAASEVWAAGLPEGDAELFDTVVDTVADEGAIHLSGMEPGLATGTVAHMDDLHVRINERFDPSDRVGTVALENSGVFLREVMRDEDGASIIVTGTREYFSDRLDALDHPGASPPAEGREAYLEETGRTLGAISESHANALLANGADEDSASGDHADQANFFAGLIPGGGKVNDLADAFVGPGIGNVIFDESAYDTAQADAQNVIHDLDDALAVTTATHHYNIGTTNGVDANAAAQQDVDRYAIEGHTITDTRIEMVFLDPGGQPRSQLPAFDDMNTWSQTIVLDWANSPGATGAGSTSPQIRIDYEDLRDGATDTGDLLRGEDD